ncbi:hypothetical protein [Streptomyces sp. NPDC001020]
MPLLADTIPAEQLSADEAISQAENASRALMVLLRQLTPPQRVDEDVQAAEVLDGAGDQNVEVLWHSPRATQDNLEFGAKVGAWDAVDPGLKSFAHKAVASRVGCSWCLDVGYFQAQNENLYLVKASQGPP